MELYHGGIQTLPSLPKRAKSNLYGSIVPADPPLGSYLELKVVVRSEGINVRELAAFLKTLDRVYGRVLGDGLISYSRRREDQLVIAEARKGSLIFLFQEYVTSFGPTVSLLLAWYFFRFAIKEVPKAYDHYQTGRLQKVKRQVLEEGLTARRASRAPKPRSRREEIRALAKQDETLGALPAAQRNAIVRYLDAMYEFEERQMPAVKRFADQVESIEIKFHADRNEDDE
ncbi:MAG: hypothetical protein IH855_13445 [Bacteroidetes bacterium]|nr:hypothetical protein [Bacteroidota bacterium]